MSFISTVRSVTQTVARPARASLVAWTLLGSACTADLASEEPISSADLAASSEAITADAVPRVYGCIAYTPSGSIDAIRRWVNLYGKFTGTTIIPNWYRNRYADLRGKSAQDLCEHFRLNGLNGRRQATPVFDVNYYLTTHADIRASTGNNPARARDHWLNNGLRNGRRGSAEFDARTYLARYPDVAAVYGASNYAGAIQHFLEFGIAEGRSGRP